MDVMSNSYVGLQRAFARVKQYRPDKRAADADTIDTVRAPQSPS